MRNSLCWNAKMVPAAVRGMLRELADYYPVTEGEGKGLSLEFVPQVKPGMLEVKVKEGVACVRYSTPAQAGRALGALLGGLVTEGKAYKETTPFHMLGIMLDCSRNAVMTVEHVKLWMRRLALLGYNMVMLYTEETYELDGEPYFGYQRGAYTKKELKAIDRYASKLNMEVIPCIQTLGHLEKMLRHSAYNSVKDTSSVMLVGEKKTYALVEKMVKHWRDVCRTDRIHIGMDETHDLGRGRYMDKNGYKPGFSLFNEHLSKVVSICKRHGLKPMIWSDMYFRLGCESGDYYDPKTVIPKRVIKGIPAEAELVYWDYYHKDEKFYRDWIRRHREMGKEPLMGSGIWTWRKYWHDAQLTEDTAGPCIDACYREKVKELFFTQWGDDGAYCDHDSAFAGMVYCADKSYGHKTPAPGALEKRFAAVCGGSYAAHTLASRMQGGMSGWNPDMWDDPLFESRFRTYAKDKPGTMAKIANGFGVLSGRLKAHGRDRTTGDLLYAGAVARAFADRYSLSASLLAAYRKKDKRGLRAVRARIPGVRKSVQRMADAFRTMWLSHNKPEGLETIQARFGMVDARYLEMMKRMDEYLGDRIDRIVELEYKCPPKG